LKAVVKRLYEAMFLVDSAAEADWDKINAIIKKILEKAGAEIVSMEKWDERRLAYEIGGKNRGTYILCYFHADGQKIRQIERDAQLSESIMRVLILGTEGRETAGRLSAEEGESGQKTMTSDFIHNTQYAIRNASCRGNLIWLISIRYC